MTHATVERVGGWLWCRGVALPIDPKMALEAMSHGRTYVSYPWGRTFEVQAALPDLLDAMTAQPDGDMAELAARIRAVAGRLGDIAPTPAPPIP